MVVAPVLEGEVDKQICFYQAYTFKSMLKHLRVTHGLNLEPIIDYCRWFFSEDFFFLQTNSLVFFLPFSTCSIVFYSTKQAALHYVQHARVFQHLNTSHDTRHQNCPDCPAIWAHLKAATHHFAMEADFSNEVEEEKEEVVAQLMDAMEAQKEDEGFVGMEEEPLAAEGLRFVDE